MENLSNNGKGIDDEFNELVNERMQQSLQKVYNAALNLADKSGEQRYVRGERVIRDSPTDSRTISVVVGRSPEVEEQHKVHGKLAALITVIASKRGERTTQTYNLWRSVNTDTEGEYELMRSDTMQACHESDALLLEGLLMNKAHYS